MSTETPSCPWCFERKAKPEPEPDEEGWWLCPCGKSFGVTQEDQREALEIDGCAHCYGCGEKRPPSHPDQPADAIFITMYEGSDEGESVCRAIVICSACLTKGDFDMWTDAHEWDSKDPLVPYRLLPPYDHDNPERDEMSKYPSPQELLAAEEPDDG